MILARTDELLAELYDVREERGLDCLFLAVVNIVELRSSLLCAGPSELSLAEARAGIEREGQPPIPPRSARANCRGFDGRATGFPPADARGFSPTV